MKKVLVISYYWPPSGGGGVQRWAKMCKYFKEFGWEPVVFIPENPDYPIIDRSFDEDVQGIKVLKGKIIEPSRILKKLGAKKEAGLNSGFVSESKSFSQRLAITIRGNFFIPDARKLWIKPSVKTLILWLKFNKVDVVVSTGPPHSAHMIALALKKQTNIPWIADFRDPWTNIDFYKDLNLSKWADRRHRQMEQKVLHSADLVVSVGKTLGDELLALGASKVKVITNGYDEKIPTNELDTKFTMTHIGRLGAARNPIVLWDVLSKLVHENQSFSDVCQIQLVGNVDGEVKKSVDEFGLNNVVKYIDDVSNEESLQIQSKSQVLLLLINDTPNAKGILTGKFFEYLSTGRPIICIGPQDGDAAEILQNCDAGLTFCFKDSVGLKQHVEEQFQKYLKGTLKVESTGIGSYTRQHLAKRYTELFNDLLDD